MAGELQSSDQRLVPVPDPTVLTTEALNREINHLRELIDMRLGMIETQRVELKADTRAAIDTALTAQQLETRQLRDDLSSIRDRVGALESIKLGGQQATTSIYAYAGLIATLLAVVGYFVGTR
jgi:uncharacterized coiled-coil protein SlyX